MAARKDPRNRDSSYKLQSAMQLINRLIKHAEGELDLSPTQIQAAKIVIAKYVPDLKAIEISGNQEKPVVTVVERRIIDGSAD